MSDILHRKQSRLQPLLSPIQAFLSAESAGGIVLLLAAVTALAWANSPWGGGYDHVWHTKLSVGLGDRTFAMSLQHWVNDGLMVLFFLLVGLEIKRELLLGELASPRRAALPIAAAVGGMVFPALIFAAINAGGPGAHGWGVPMATDIAFAVGVLALVGRSVPISVKVLLLAIAIVDDLGAVLVIALFYTSKVSATALAVAAAFLLALVLLNALRVHSPLPYVLLGVGLWAATLASGLHATIAGVLLAFTIPATRQLEERPYVEVMGRTLARFATDADAAPDRITNEQSHAIKAMEEASQAVQTPLARVEHALLRPVTFLIVPLFALGTQASTSARARPPRSPTRSCGACSSASWPAKRWGCSSPRGWRLRAVSPRCPPARACATWWALPCCAASGSRCRCSSRSSRSRAATSCSPPPRSASSPPR
jgi:Na+:H+ antiporter, NhaA family